jgi:hypothetical protein
VSPEGASYSPNTLSVLFKSSDGKTVIASEKSQALSYAYPRHDRTEGLGGPVDGCFLVTLTGRDFSRFRPPAFSPPVGNPLSAPWCRDKITALVKALPPVDNSVDASANSTWTAAIKFETLRDTITTGTVLGDYAPIVRHSHSSVTFVMPPFEGKVEARILISKASGALPYPDPSSVSIEAARITVTALEAIVAAGEFDADPCSALNANTSGADTCMQAARQIDDTGTVLRKDSPCFRANTSSTGVQTKLRIGGTNFGSRSTDLSIFLVRPTAERATMNVAELKIDIESNKDTRMRCVPIEGLTPLINSSILECTLGTSLTWGGWDVVVLTPFSAGAASASGLFPRAVCACGTYARADGICARCIAGASCAGALDRPRALRDAWETIDSEYMSRGLDPPVNQSVPPFTLCPRPGICAGNNKCVEGSRGWMCSWCEDNWAPKGSGACVECVEQDVKILYILVGVLVLLAYPAYLFYLWVMKKCVARGNQLRAAREARYRSGNGTCATGKERPWSAYAKIMVTYSQTLIALWAYCASLEESPQNVAVPAVLRNFAYIGQVLSTHTMRCALSGARSDYGVMVILTIFTPFFAAGSAFALVALYYIARGSYAKMYQDGDIVSSTSSKPEAAVDEKTAAGRSLSLVSGPPRRSQAYATRELEKTPIDAAVRLATYSVCVVVFTILPSVISGLATAQACADSRSGNYLLDDPRVSCWDQRFRGVQAFAKVMGWMYLIVPVGVAVALSLNVADSEAPVRVNFAFLTEGYKAKVTKPFALAWECLTLIRTAIMLGLPTGFVEFKDKRSQVTMSMFLLALALAALVHTMPFIDSQLNIIEAMSLFSQLTFAFSVMIRLQGSLGAATLVDGCFGKLSALDCASEPGLSDPEAAVGLGLTRIDASEIGFVDAASIVTAFLFFIAYFFLLVDEKVFDHQGELKIRQLLVYLRGRMSCRRAPRLAAPMLDMETEGNGLSLFKARPIGAWYRIRDHENEVFWRNDALGVSADELPFGAVTTGGWRSRLDPASNDLCFVNAARKLTSWVLPEDDTVPFLLPAEEARGGSWVRESLNVFDGLWVWRDLISNETCAGQPPVGARSLSGWERIANAEGVPFWFHRPTQRALETLLAADAVAPKRQLVIRNDSVDDERASFRPVSSESPLKRDAPTGVSQYVIDKVNEGVTSRAQRAIDKTLAPKAKPAATAPPPPTMMMSHEDTIRLFEVVGNFSSAEMTATTNETISNEPIMAPPPDRSDDVSFSVSNPLLTRERPRPPPASSVPSQFTIDFVAEGQLFEAQQAARKAKARSRSSAKEGAAMNAPSDSPLFKRQGGVEPSADTIMGARVQDAHDNFSFENPLRGGANTSTTSDGPQYRQGPDDLKISGDSTEFARDNPMHKR